MATAVHVYKLRLPLLRLRPLPVLRYNYDNYTAHHSYTRPPAELSIAHDFRTMTIDQNHQDPWAWCYLLPYSRNRLHAEDALLCRMLTSTTTKTAMHNAETANEIVWAGAVDRPIGAAPRETSARSVPTWISRRRASFDLIGGHAQHQNKSAPTPPLRLGTCCMTLQNEICVCVSGFCGFFFIKAQVQTERVSNRQCPRCFVACNCCKNRNSVGTASSCVVQPSFENALPESSNAVSTFRNGCGAKDLRPSFSPDFPPAAY